MNRILLYPLLFMFIVTVYAVVASGDTYGSLTDDFGDTEEVEINSTIGDETGYYVPPETETYIDIWIAAGAITLLGVAIVVGTASGFNLLGSGISELSQSFIFSSVLFVGLWTLLSILSSDFFFDTPLLTIAWGGLTTMFAVGLGMHMTGGTE